MKRIFNKKNEVEISDDDLRKQLDSLLVLCYDKLITVDEDLISKAFYFNYKSHKDQIRKSGEPYYIHPLEVAKILVKYMPLDDISVAAALLHDVVAISKKYSLDDIKYEFGSQVYEIIMGLSSIKSIEKHDIKHFENYRKLLLSWLKDIRIILIKLADRLHNLMSLDSVDEERQKIIAEETLEIYAPFAHRFGLANIKSELEDYSFKYLHKDLYYEIVKNVKLSKDERDNYLKKFIQSLESDIKAILEKFNSKFKIYGRAKHIYSIYNKTILRQKSIDELYDLFAIRIIIDKDDANLCYKVLDYIISKYELMPDTLKDYIKEPKKNGYQSIHFGVFGIENHKVEVQIRTKRMHEIAEKGVAAHFIYKRGSLPENTILDNDKLSSWMTNVRSIFESSKGKLSDEQLNNIKNNLFFDEVYVFTPNNEFRILPKGSTPLDFAYAIHTELGLHCIGAKVNGHIVPLNSKLLSGDQVEIITSKKQLPKEEWLKMAVTHRAHYYINKSLNEQKLDNIKKGKAIWKDINKKFIFNISDDVLSEFIFYLGYNSINNFFLDIINPEFDFLTLKNNYILFLNHKNNISLNNHISNNPFNDYNKDKLLTAEFSKCCYPIPDDDIICIQNEKNNYIIHRENCKELKNSMNLKINYYKISWEILNKENFTSKIIIYGDENSNLLNNLSKLINEFPEINITGLKFDNPDKNILAKVKLIAKNKVIYDKFIIHLQLIDGITKIERE